MCDFVCKRRCIYHRLDPMHWTSMYRSFWDLCKRWLSEVVKIRLQSPERPQTAPQAQRSSVACMSSATYYWVLHLWENQRQYHPCHYITQAILVKITGRSDLESDKLLQPPGYCLLRHEKPLYMQEYPPGTYAFLQNRKIYRSMSLYGASQSSMPNPCQRICLRSSLSGL